MNNLLKNHKVMKEYNYEKNKDVDLNSLTVGSSKNIWWKCSICGNEWQAVICNRTNGNGCPKCNINGAKRVNK